MKRKCLYLAGAAFFLVIGIGHVMAEESGDVTFGNNLSFPVIWSDGVEKVLRGAPGMTPEIGGAWWYWWGTDAEGNPLSCAPDNDDINFCDDGLPGSVGSEPGGRQRAYLQQDELNVWQAETIYPDGPVAIDWIDWGDNLEAVLWYLNSMVRIEVVLINDSQGALSYKTDHLFGWGITEMWGLSFDPGENRFGELIATQATVYSHCARLTIQKLTDGCDPATSVWSGTAWSGECVGNTIFSGAVREAGDGLGFYSAEINVKGRIVYGYTWDVKAMNAGPGKYRLTFSLDSEGLCPELNTSFSVAEGTQIYLPVEEEATDEVVVSEESGDVPSGGTAVIAYDKSVTYIDIDIIEKVSNKKKKNGKK
ncbi:MAG: Uncharacterized protein Athens071425_237 [Parcubacteria group bacterium Athens0714_25]|nr:MAG: Uncharacterized protein Athens071425_237 [Parcubacteria group bacterium Athens0714_25]